LGVTFYELLTGVRPVGTWRPVSTLNSTVPKVFDRVVGKLLAYKPEDRFASTDELGVALADKDSQGPLRVTMGWAMDAAFGESSMMPLVALGFMYMSLFEGHRMPSFWGLVKACILGYFMVGTAGLWAWAAGLIDQSGAWDRIWRMQQGRLAIGARTPVAGVLGWLLGGAALGAVIGWSSSGWIRAIGLGLLGGDLGVIGRTIAWWLAPADAGTYIERGRAFLTYNTELAAACFDQAIRLEPRCAAAYSGRGEALRWRNPARSLADLSEAIRLDPEYVPAYISRINQYLDKGEPDRAAADYLEAIRLDPSSLQPPQVRTLVHHLIHRGANYYNNGEYDKAIADFSRAIQFDPKNSDAFSRRGISYEDKGDLDRAIDDFSRAIQFDPKNSHAFSRRGISYEAKGDHDRAIDDYTEAIRLCTESPAYIYSNRGAVYISLGDHDRAISDCSEAIRLSPDLVPAYLNRASAYDGKGHHDRAVADCTEALRLRPDDPFVLDTRGRSYLALGRLDEAIADFEAALRLNPPDPQRYEDLLRAARAARDGGGRGSDPA
jgi:tetratricopeptide (TPR) repeat protein